VKKQGFRTGAKEGKQGGLKKENEEKFEEKGR